MAKKRKVHSLTGRIDDRLMMQSFIEVKRNRGAAGIDKVSIAMFEENLNANLAALKRDLKTRDAFVAKPLRRVLNPKDASSKTFRPLGIPAVRDRGAQEVIRRLLEPIFEPLFHDCSFGFRPQRSCHKAIERLLSFHNAGERITLDADIAGFFDNIPQKLIVDAVAEEEGSGTRSVRTCTHFRFDESTCVVGQGKMPQVKQVAWQLMRMIKATDSLIYY
ncbi:MAG: reverse transcriptase domain-containing protein [Planctomycetota bacterium]